ncbi:CRISPR-associated endonuclease Cas2 [Bacillus sp. 165]|uniref:CRISPR-associated endonuclease Cas2 n=1 Tax=Bacillus sp. 165 TaxID=1529117 RepID=UPI001AD9A61F|nr:CRISPR-associated endonuclease Cas2 [Bacillus sp. 165]MBO9129098.1 CRISPR-associated endonuclease Cas2 [Bacillus sp. 165]
MPMQPKKYYLVCYDIEETKRRNKVAKKLKDYGVRVQKSIFEAYLDKDSLDQMVEVITPFVLEQDSLRIYSLNKSAFQQTLVYGQSFYYDPEEDVII